MQSSQPLVSVVIPSYNHEQFVQDTIQSVIDQDYKNIELIIIDDGSKDNSGEICEKWRKRDKRIIVIHKKNGGLSSARNAGIEIASGKYIAFIDSDDYVSKDMYYELYQRLIENESDIIICGREYIWDNGKTYFRYHYDGRIENYNSKQAIKEMKTFSLCAIMKSLAF